MTTEIIPVFCNEKNMANYAYLIKSAKDNHVIIIDAAELQPIISIIEKQKLIPTHILATHHHFDHNGANQSLKQKYNLTIIAPQKEFDLIPGADIPAIEDNPIKIRDLNFDVISAPGHTKGHVLYHLKKEKMLFTGDVLFNLCIGGLFEGTHKEMFLSLQKIKSLPDDTLIFPGHEYTRSALTEDFLHNPKTKIYLQKMLKREQGLLAPSSLKEEKEFNPYLQLNNLEFIGQM